MRMKLFVLAIVMLGLVSVPAGASDYSVIGNSSIPASLSKSDLQAIFLGEKTKWDNGKPVKIVVLQGSSSKSFLGDVVGKTPQQFDNHWKKQVFTGKAKAPTSFSDSSEVISFVSSTAGAIGFVSGEKPSGSSKIITVK
jgi:ABC-type phosphate transport system substrate-binding protein